MIHTLYFAEPPTYNRLQEAVEDLGLHCYRFRNSSMAGCIFEVEELSLDDTISWKPKNYPDAVKMASKVQPFTKLRQLSPADLAEFT